MDTAFLRGGWGIVERLKARVIESDLTWAARPYRLLLQRVTFIGVTGSCGKTTTTELIAAVLNSRMHGLRNRGNSNLPRHLAGYILGVRPWDDFCVLEIAAAQRGNIIGLERPLRLVRPRIGVVTNIGSDHISAFGSIEAIAAEKGKLIAALPSNGTAVLNADDPNVMAMRARSAAQVVTYGLGPDAMVRAENVHSAWPSRLTFTARYQDQACKIETQLCGAHLVPSVLAAIAVGLTMRVPLADAARALQATPPVKRRMYPVVRDDGVCFIRDDFKSPLWSIPAAFEFMKEARAKRKIVVVGTISDYRGEDATAVSVALQALAVADYVIFVGPKAFKCIKARTRPYHDRLQAYLSLEHAEDMLSRFLRPGDLVLLKGTWQDELDRLLNAGYQQGASSDLPAARIPPDAVPEPTRPLHIALEGAVAPGSEEVRSGARAHPQPNGRRSGPPELEAERKLLRSRMQNLYSQRNALFKEIGAAKRSGAGDSSALKARAAEVSSELRRLAEELEDVERRIDAPTGPRVDVAQPAWVVGLGNPAEALRDTPHNVGHAVVDLLARELTGDWAEDGDAVVSAVNWKGRQVLLVKPMTPMNSTGPVLLELARRRRLSSDNAILVHDDVALTLGTVRVRTKGTDGGHKGVRSILEAFESDAFARVKIGVATPSRLEESLQGVLTPFTADELQAMVQAYPVAHEKILELLRTARVVPAAALQAQ
jgi:aminoacyl-tRNA hydrolase